MLARISLVRWLCVALCVEASARASAQSDAGFAFDWGGPDGCPSSDTVQGEIDKLLGGSAASHSKRLLRVRARVTRGPLWHVVLETALGESQGHRTLKAATCDGLANATALIVALMIDPAAVRNHAPTAAAETAHEIEPATSVEPPAPAPRSPAPLLPAPPVPAVVPLAGPTAARITTVFAGAGASGSLGVLPSADVQVAGELGVAREPWRIELRAAYGPRHVKGDLLASPSGSYGGRGPRSGRGCHHLT